MKDYNAGVGSNVQEKDAKERGKMSKYKQGESIAQTNITRYKDQTAQPRVNVLSAFLFPVLLYLGPKYN